MAFCLSLRPWRRTISQEQKKERSPFISSSRPRHRLRCLDYLLYNDSQPLRCISNRIVSYFNATFRTNKKKTMIQVPEVYPPSTQQQSSSISSMSCRRRRVPLTPHSIWPSLMVLVASSLLLLLVQAREVPMQKAIPPLMDPIP